MGSQWNEMGRDLMTLDVFKRSIERADEILKPYNVSASQSILSKDKSTFDDIVNSFVAVASIQVNVHNYTNDN